MAYSPWQIDKIRRALNRYRIVHSHNAKPRSWFWVHSDILSSDKTVHEFHPDGETPPVFKQEALRRFACGSQVLEQERLEDLYVFLKDKGFLPKADWEEEATQLKAFLGLHAYLANGAGPGQNAIRRSAGTYTAGRHVEGISEDVTLRIVRHESGKFVHIEEFVEVADDDVRIAGQKRRDINRREFQAVRRGFGLTATLENLLYFFLRSDIEQGDIVYVQVGDPVLQGMGGGFSLMRSGAKPLLGLTPRDPDPLLTYNIYNFVKTEAPV